MGGESSLFEAVILASVRSKRFRSSYCELEREQKKWKEANAFFRITGFAGRRFLFRLHFHSSLFALVPTLLDELAG